MNFIVSLVLVYTCINKSYSIDGKYTKKIKDARIVFPVRVTKERINIEDQNIEQRFKRSEAHLETPIHFKILLGGKEEYIDLTPNPNLFAEGAVLEFRTNDSTFPEELSNIKTRVIPDHQSIYSGVVQDNEDSSVALSTYNGLCGFIRIKRQVYLIEPAGNYLPNQKMPHILYEYSHDNKIRDVNCAVNLASNQILKKHSSSRRQCLSNENIHAIKNNHTRNLPLHLETLLVVDKAMIENHLPLSELENYVFTVLNMAQSLFHDLTIKPINIEVVRTVYLIDDSEKINQEKVKSAIERLRSFSEWQYLINPRSEEHPNHHDLAVLLTRNDICDKNGDCQYLGIAEQNGVCNPKHQATICKDNGLLLGYTLAHEIAHVLGIEHDTDLGNSCDPKMSDGSSSVMSPIISFDSKEWTKCSQESLAALIEEGYLSCLVDEPTTRIANSMNVLPGVIYGADFQCKRLFNQDAKACNNDGDCNCLKCQFDGTSCTNTGIPLVPGTPCEQNKWCYHGECVDAGDRPESVHGGWSTWSEWSQCSRSCGSGICVSTRDCNNPKPRNDGKMCSGQRKKHKICSIEPCPVEGISFRDVQCAAYNDWIFPEDEKTHIWKGYLINNGNPCALTCKNENNVVVSLNPMVIDGTTCYRGIRDVCIDGICSDIPCDLQLNSKSVEDSCGICHGNGTECKILQGTKLIKGLASIIPSVPAGSRNVKVKVLTPMNSHILVKAIDNKRELNVRGKFGMFMVPGSIGWIGMSKPNQELLEIPGPISEPISIWATSDGPQTVAYSVGLPSEPREGIYTWDYIDWLPCTSQCGAGIQEAIPKCVELMSGHVEDIYCKHLEKPRVKRRCCDAGPCYTRWLIGEWHECGPCPSRKAKRFRLVRCVKPVAGLEEGTAFVPTEECLGSPPISSEYCQCLKLQTSYWPHYHAHKSLKTGRNLLLNGYKMRPKRSTTIPEKKVTLMQLESESEESMLKQYKENQNKHNPFVYMPSFFGARYNFTIPLKKRQALPLQEENVASSQDNLKNDITNESSENLLEDYLDNSLFYSSFLPPIITEHTFNNSVLNRLNIKNFSSPMESSTKNNNFVHKSDSKYLMPSYINNLSRETPLQFSDQNILKILSDNLALHKLKKEHETKIIERQHNPMFSNEKIFLHGYDDRKNVDFLNSIGNQLYKALEMQEYLQSLLNTSQYNHNVHILKNVINKNGLDHSSLKRYKVKLLSLNNPSLNNEKENVYSNYSKQAPLKYLNLKLLNDSNCKSNNFLRNRNIFFLSGIPSNSNRKMNGLDDIQNNIFESYGKPFNNDQTKIFKSIKNSIFNSPQWTTEPLRKKQMPGVYTNNYYEDYQTVKNLENNETKERKKENALINKIIDKLSPLSYENKMRIHNDLIYINKYLKTLINSDILRNTNSLNKTDTENKGEVLNFKNDGVVHAHPFRIIEKNQIYSQNFNNNCNPNYLTNGEDVLQNEEENTLHSSMYNQLYYNAMLNGSYQHYPLLWKREIPYNYYPTYLMNDRNLFDSHSSVELKTNERQNYYLRQNDEDILRELGGKRSINLVGPLKFIYPIPKERECTTSAKPTYIITSPCRDKRNASNVIKNYDIPTNFVHSNPNIYFTGSHNPDIDSKLQNNSCNEQFPTSKYVCTNAPFKSLQTSTNSPSNKNDTFYCPPKFDDPIDTNSLKCMDNLLYELQKELQLARHRQCTGCYFVYKDETTMPTKCTSN